LDRQHIDHYVRKGTDPEIDSYSGFFDNGHRKATGLEEYLRAEGVTDVYVCGLTTDYCVKATALDAARLGFRTWLVRDAVRGVNLQAGDAERAIAEMREHGVRIVESAEILR
jgi:nicotinamidase/pyrazinamidase